MDLSRIKKEFGMYSSFCVWNDKVDDLSVFDDEENLHLKTNIIFLGLNVSRCIGSPFSNFHDGRPHSSDMHLKNALLNTEYYGAYITDLYKDYKDVNGGKVLSYFKKNPEKEIKHFKLLEKEIAAVCNSKPIFVLLKKDDNFTKAFKRFCEYVGVQYLFLEACHYAQGHGPKLRKILLDNPLSKFEKINMETLTFKTAKDKTKNAYNALEFLKETYSNKTIYQITNIEELFDALDLSDYIEYLENKLKENWINP